MEKAGRGNIFFSSSFWCIQQEHAAVYCVYVTAAIARLGREIWNTASAIEWTPPDLIRRKWLLGDWLLIQYASLVRPSGKPMQPGDDVKLLFFLALSTEHFARPG